MTATPDPTPAASPLPALRAELRRVGSTRLWWALLIPLVVLAAVVNLFGGLLGAAGDAGGGGGDGGGAAVLLVSLAFTATLVAVFAAVHGTVFAGSEFRHRTIGTSYLTVGGRGRVLVGKLAAGAAVGALYAAVAALVGVGAGLVGRRGGPLPLAGQLLAVAAVGVAVAALWGATGAALAMLVGNQVGALVGLLVYLAVVEHVVGSLLESADSTAVAGLASYLPGNAGHVAIFGLPAQTLGDAGYGDEIAGQLAGVGVPLPWWGALAVLAGWAALASLLAWRVAGRRDVT